MPLARQDELVVEDLPDETLVYDLKGHKAHCLNRTAALVWRHCDGRTSVAEVAALLEEQLATPTDDVVVWMALDPLGRAHLLSEPCAASSAPAMDWQYAFNPVNAVRRKARTTALSGIVNESAGVKYVW